MKAALFSIFVSPSCVARKESCCTTRLCSVMSRRNAVNIGGPVAGTRLSDSSAGNSVPSARMAVVSNRRPSRP